jgi:hypothetical protein
MGRTVMFFATKKDSLALLLALEEKSPLYYVRAGYYNSPTAPVYSSAAEIPDLGAPTRPHRGSDRYFVFARSVPLIFHKFTLKDGVDKFEVMAPENVSWVHLHSGGLHGDDCMVMGVIETALSRSEDLRLFEAINRAIRKRFTQVKSSGGRTTHVGPEALELLRARRTRFIVNGISQPPSLDFKLPRGWRPAEQSAAAAGPRE